MHRSLFYIYFFLFLIVYFLISVSMCYRLQTYFVNFNTQHGMFNNNLFFGCKNSRNFAPFYHGKV